MMGSVAAKAIVGLHQQGTSIWLAIPVVLIGFAILKLMLESMWDKTTRTVPTRNQAETTRPTLSLDELQTKVAELRTKQGSPRGTVEERINRYRPEVKASTRNAEGDHPQRQTRVETLLRQGLQDAQAELATSRRALRSAEQEVERIRQELLGTQTELKMASQELASLKARQAKPSEAPGNEGLRRAEIKELIKACHPDKWQNHPVATELTKELTALLEKRGTTK